MNSIETISKQWRSGDSAERRIFCPRTEGWRRSAETPLRGTWFGRLALTAALLLWLIMPGACGAAAVEVHGFGVNHYPNGLVLGADGNFYGTTVSGDAGGNAGMAFKMTPDGTLTKLATFQGANGIAPWAGLIQGTNGNFYGTTHSGGAYGYGTVFQMTPGGTVTTLASFNNTNGAYPEAALLQGLDGNFYGTTYRGGTNDAGTIFTMTPEGVLATLLSFTIWSQNTYGKFPKAGLVQGTDGNFYGTTYSDIVWNGGMIFQVTTGGIFSILYSFTGVYGANPCAGLVQGTNGNFYGTTYYSAIGSPNGFGTVFKITPSGTLTTLVTFTQTNSVNHNGWYPKTGLVLGTDGNFYGTTYGGGTNGCGTIFKLTHAGTLTMLVSFSGTNGSGPNSELVQGPDGNFYGTTEACGADGDYGTIFRMTPDGTLTTLVRLNETNGAEPQAALVQGTNGNYYGTTFSGGVSNLGTAFQLTPSGQFTNLVSFYGTNGSAPRAMLAPGTNGLFYGTTYQGGASNLGTIFQMAADGTLATLVAFSNANGALPYSALAQGADGNFYGTTTSGGTGNGTVFKLGGWVVSFSGASGATPWAGLVQGTNGNFYGATEYGGTSNMGTIFMVTPAGALTTLAVFYGTNGACPTGGLVLGTDGNFYGTTQNGGAYGYGTVFQMMPDGTIYTLVSFNWANGYCPRAGLLLGADGNFYGTTVGGGTYGYGTAFQVTPSGVLNTLLSFNGDNGLAPFAGLAHGTGGNLWGTTTSGGSGGGGNIFTLVVPPTIQAMAQTDNIIALTWSAWAGLTYHLQYTTNLRQAAWNDLATITIDNSSGRLFTVTVFDFIGPDPQRFYRVMLGP